MLVAAPGGEWRIFSIGCNEKEEADVCRVRWRRVCFRLGPLSPAGIKYRKCSDSALIKSTSPDLAFLYSLLFTENVPVLPITNHSSCNLC